MGRRLIGLALVAGGVAVGYGWMSHRVTNPFTLASAILLVGAGALLLPSTHRLADRVRPLVGQSVRARAWGAALPGHEDATFRLHAVRAIGAGLHLYLLPLPDGKPLHLKVAQPTDVIVDAGGVKVPGAKYVQWAGRKIRKVEGEKALVLERSNA